ncbi:hypothetical protein BgiBS90_006952 [Biomphalaria glabrata]|nr:hypothetical protein BgiBS90_006952 [Biomphalaria glabrata]
MVSHVKEGVDSLVKEQLPVDSLVKKLRGQDCGCTNSGDGDAGDLSTVCVCVVGKSCGCDFQDEKRDNDCCDDLKGMYRVERKETNEVFVPVVPVTSTLTEVCYVPEAFVPVVPDTSTSMNQTDEDNVGSASKPVAMDFKDLCLSAGAYEAKSELSRGRHSKLELEETYLLDVRLLSEDDCGALDFVCNVAACEPAAPLRGVCREGLLRQRVRSMAVLKKTVLDTISLCVKRPRHYRNNILVNWRKRKRHWRKT